MTEEICKDCMNRCGDMCTLNLWKEGVFHCSEYKPYRIPRKEVERQLAELKLQLTEKDKEIEELKKELNEWKINNDRDNWIEQLKEKDKQIEELKKQSKRQSENYKHDCGVLLRNIAELEAQVEKMKVCSNCKYKYIQDNVDLGEGTRTDPCLSCRSHNMWEFAD